MARAFAGEGAAIWVTDIDADALAGCPADWQATRVDAADPEGMAMLYEAVTTRWGGLDVLCANAGIAGPTAGVEDVTLAEWRSCLGVNLDGAFLAAQGAARMMKPAGGGIILLTSSTAGLHGYPNRAPYAAAKWGVIGLMKTLAMELGPHGVRANAICPGAVEGPRMDGVLARQAAAEGTTPEALYHGYAAGSSLRRWATAEDVAGMAVFLASDAARMISGQAVAVDGHTENPAPRV